MQIKAVTVLHSEMVRIQTIHLKNWAIKIDNWSLDFFFFYEYAGPWHKKGWEPLI